MADGHSPARHINRLWTVAQVAAVVITIIGFTPVSWVSFIFQSVELPAAISGSFLSVIDYRLLFVGMGVSIFAADTVLRNRRRARRRATTAAAPAIGDSEEITGKPSVAVLPFVNMSSDPEKEFFADGMTEDIITGLSCDSRLNVTARNSTFVYKGKPVDIRAVGKELGVRYLVEGSIRPAGEQLRITVQLIEAASGNHVWADKIDRPASEILAVMDEVTDGLVTALCSNLGAAESNRAGRARPENIQAWALCVQAEHLIFTISTPEALAEAGRLARRAAEIEPSYGVGWATLAYLASLKISWGYSADLAGDSQAVLALAGKALGLAPNDPVVLSYCGFALIWAGHGAQALSYFERSLAINPNSNFAQVSYGAALNVNGRIQDALAQLQTAIRRAPKDPFTGVAYFFLAYVYLLLDDFTGAESAARICVGFVPGFPWARLCHATSLAALGRDAEAQAQMAEVRRVMPGWTMRHVDEFWNHIFADKSQAAKLTALTRMAWRD